MLGVIQRYVEIFHHSPKYQGILNLGIHRVFHNRFSADKVIFLIGGNLCIVLIGDWTRNNCVFHRGRRFV